MTGPAQTPSELALLIDVIQRAEVCADPFPFWWLDRVFEDGLAKEMSVNWPKTEEMVSYPDTGRVPQGTYESRTVLPLNDVGLDRVAGKQREFWSKLRDVLTHQHLLETLLSKFDDHLSLSRFEKASIGDLIPDVLLVQDREGYVLPPHTDAPSKLFTWITYLPPDGDRDELGTSFYVTDDRQLHGAREVHHERSHFREVRRFPYVRNAALSFLRTDASFHGVERVNLHGSERRLLLYTCYIGGLPAHFRF